MDLSTTSSVSYSSITSACIRAFSDGISENLSEISDGGVREPGKKRRDPRKVYACPFFKNDPSKYDTRKTRLCAERGWEDVSRLKEHLTRVHTAKNNCSRCFRELDNRDESREHKQTNFCRLTSGRPSEGIGPEVVEKLRSRKKYSRHQSQEDKWTEIYRMLFPGRKVPSPYFQRRADRSPTSNLNDLENDLRQEVSRRVSLVLDECMPTSFDKKVLLENIDEVQKDVFNNYRTSSRSEVANTTGTPSSYSSPLLLLDTKVETDSHMEMDKRTLSPDFGAAVGCSYSFLDPEEWNVSHSTGLDVTVSAGAWWSTADIDVEWDNFITVGEGEKALGEE